SSCAGWTSDKLPWQSKFIGQMRSKRFNAESLRCVMAAQQKIHSQLFSANNCPISSFAGDKGVDIFLSHAVDLRASGAGDNADGAGLLRPEIERFHRTVQRSGESANELFTRKRNAFLQSNGLAFFLKKWLERF